MNRFIVLFLIVFVLLVQGVSYGEMRNWTGSNGKVIEAEMIGFDESTEIVKIRLKNGREQNVRIDLFSSSDQDFVRNQGKADNPFGEPDSNKATKTPSKPIDMKFVMDEAKKVMEQFEQSHKKPLTIGNLPRVYADYAVILFHSGEKEEARKSLEKAFQWNEPITDESSQGYNGITLALRAISIGHKDITQKIVDKIGVSNVGSLSLLFVLGYETEAVLSVAKRQGKSKAYGLGNLANEYLKKGDMTKAKELFTSAEAASQGDVWFPNWVAQFWIKAGKADEAQEIINRTSNGCVKGSILAYLALHYLETGNSEEMRKLAADALIKADHTHTQADIIYNIFLMNDLETYRTVRANLIREMESNANIPHASPAGSMQRLVRMYLQEMLIDGSPSSKEMIDRTEKIIEKRPGMKPADLASIYRLLVHVSVLFGDKRNAVDALKKMERYVKEMDDTEGMKNFYSADVERFKSGSNDPHIVMSLIYEGFPVLIKSGQSDRIQPILERIKQPQAKIDALRVIAEELNKK